jgi:hypothetical protein
MSILQGRDHRKLKNDLPRDYFEITKHKDHAIHGKIVKRKHSLSLASRLLRDYQEFLQRI